MNTPCLPAIRVLPYWARTADRQPRHGVACTGGRRPTARLRGRFLCVCVLRYSTTRPTTTRRSRAGRHRQRGPVSGGGRGAWGCPTPPRGGGGQGRDCGQPRRAAWRGLVCLEPASPARDGGHSRHGVWCLCRLWGYGRPHRRQHRRDPEVRRCRQAHGQGAIAHLPGGDYCDDQDVVVDDAYTKERGALPALPRDPPGAWARYGRYPKAPPTAAKPWRAATARGGIRIGGGDVAFQSRGKRPRRYRGCPRRRLAG